MNDAEYKAWVRGLISLSPTQLSDLQGRMKILGPVPAGPNDNPFVRRVADIIITVLLKYGAESMSPVALAKYAANPKHKTKLEDLAAYLRAVSDKRLVQDKILKVAVGLLYHDLLNWQKVAISPYTLINQIHRIPATINRHFPGYAASGMLEIIVGYNAEDSEGSEPSSSS